MMFQIFDHVKRKVKGSIVAIIVPLGYKRLKIYVLVACIIKTFSFEKMIIFLIVSFQTTNIIVPTIDLIIRLSPLDLHKQSWCPTNSSSHGRFENDGLKKVKLEFPKLQKIQDDLKSYILKVQSNKAMPTWLMKNWKTQVRRIHFMHLWCYLSILPMDQSKQVAHHIMALPIVICQANEHYR